MTKLLLKRIARKAGYTIGKLYIDELTSVIPWKIPTDWIKV